MISEYEKLLGTIVLGLLPLHSATVSLPLPNKEQY